MICQERGAQPAVSSSQAVWSWRAMGALCDSAMALHGSRLKCLGTASSPELSVGQERSVSLILMSGDHAQRERKSVFNTPLKLLGGREWCLFNSLQLCEPRPAATCSPAVQNSEGAERELSFHNRERGSARSDLLRQGNAGAPS